MLFLQIMRDGGPVMWLIAACSLVAVFIFVEKWFQFHREQVNVKELIKGLFNVLKRDGYIEAISLCDNTPGPAARLLAAAILAYEHGENDIRQAIEDANSEEIPKLEKHIVVLGTIGYVAPLLGLLGTVLGMMQAFQTIHSKSVYLSAGDLSGAINLALTTTAAGLCVAIPCYIAYNYLISRISSITQEMEKAASEITFFFKNHKSGDKELLRRQREMESAKNE